MGTTKDYKIAKAAADRVNADLLIHQSCNTSNREDMVKLAFLHTEHSEDLELVATGGTFRTLGKFMDNADWIKFAEMHSPRDLSQ